jgi:hypothetical protein
MMGGVLRSFQQKVFASRICLGLEDVKEIFREAVFDSYETKGYGIEASVRDDHQ